MHKKCLLSESATETQSSIWLCSPERADCYRHQWHQQSHNTYVASDMGVLFFTKKILQTIILCVVMSFAHMKTKQILLTQSSLLLQTDTWWLLNGPEWKCTLTDWYATPTSRMEVKNLWSRSDIYARAQLVKTQWLQFWFGLCFILVTSSPPSAADSKLHN